MSQRCSAHNAVEPCVYCQKLIPAFSGWRERVEALEKLFMGFVKENNLIPPNPDVPMKNFDIRQAIAVVRDVGVGDIVMLAPALRALKEKDPGRPLVFVTKPQNYEILAGAKYLDAILPLDVFEEAEFYKTYNLNLAVETEENGGKLSLEKYLSKPRTEIFAELLGVADMPRKFALDVHEGALAHMRGYLGNLKRPLIGLAPTCRSPLRVIPPEFVAPLAELLGQYGGTVVLMGKTESWNQHLTSVAMRGLINFLDKLSIKDLIAACSLMDAMIVPNTGTLHIAGSLGVKTLAVEGNNDPKIFVDVYPSAKAIHPRPKELPCVPCGDQRRTCALRPGQYGADCMHLLTPQRIYDAFRAIYNGRNVAWVRDIDINGASGAEVTDKAMVEAGEARGYKVKVFDNSKTAEELYDLFDYDLIVVSNCWLFDQPKLDIVMKAIGKVPFIRYEHDHRSLEARWREYAEPLFHHSQFNVFGSPAHREDYREGLGVDGVCVVPAMDIEMFRAIPGVRKPKSVLIGTPRKWNPRKLAEYVVNRAGVTVFGDKLVPHEKMPEIYSKHETFVHLPQGPWSFERVIFEAALCGCKVETNANAQGSSWGVDLNNPEKVRFWLRNQPTFWDVVEEKIWKEKEDALSGHRGDSLRRLSSGPVAIEKWA